MSKIIQARCGSGPLHLSAFIRWNRSLTGFIAKIGDRPLANQDRFPVTVDTQFYPSQTMEWVSADLEAIHDAVVLVSELFLPGFPSILVVLPHELSNAREKAHPHFPKPESLPELPHEMTSKVLTPVDGAVNS